MIRIFQITVLCCAGLALTGCSAPQENQPIWQQVKITDLAPSHRAKQPGEQLLKTINFDVYVFEIPAENISKLDDIWEILYTKPLQFNNYDTFRANSFLVGLGQVQMWGKIADLLRAADGKRTRRASLLLPDGQADDLTVVRLYDEQTIFYTSTDGSMGGATIGPGTLALHIKAEKIPGSRGVCKVNAQPVFLPPMKSPIPQLAAREKTSKVFFTCCRFGAKMSPGDLVFLGPEKYISHQMTLGSLFFSKPEGSLFLKKTEGSQPTKAKLKPAVRTFLLICTRIND